MDWLKKHKLSSTLIRQWIVEQEKARDTDRSKPEDSIE
jgi:hypothetical protein